MAVVGFVIADLALVIGAAAWTMVVRTRSRIDAAVCFGVAVVGLVATAELVAGATGHLSPVAVITVVAVASAAGVLLAWRAGTVPARLPRVRFSPRWLRRHPWESAVALLAALALGWQLFVALVLPPFAYDALNYHLTIVASWITRGDLAPATLTVCCSHYAANAELMFAWPMVLLGSDTLANTVQVGFVILGMGAVAGIARTAGISRAGAVAAAGLFAVTPVVLAQAPTGFVDVAIASMALAGLHLVLRLVTTHNRLLLLPIGIAAGFVFGTKGVGPLWGGVLLLLGVGAVVVVASRARTGWRSAAVATGGLLAVFLAFGAFWYVRNWVDTGNPVYPFRVELAGHRVFDGPQSPKDAVFDAPDHAPTAWPVAVARSWSADVTLWNHGPYNYQQVDGGLGANWVLLGLPLLVPVTVVLVRRRNPAAIVPLVAVAVLLVQPFRWWTRFTLVLPAAGAVAIVFVVESRLRRWMRNLVRAAALTLAIASVVLTSYKVDPASQAKPLTAAEVVRLAGRPDRERTVGRLFFPEYRFVDDMPDDARVLVDLDAPSIRFLSPLFGPRFTRTVAPAGPMPAGPAYVVTGPGLPLDTTLAADPHFRLVSDQRDVRVWRSE